MSVQLYTQEQIVHHVENASPTKFMYTFSKAPRFPEINKNGKTDSIYNIPDSIMKRKAAMGYGHKSDFTKKIIEEQNLYQLKEIMIQEIKEDLNIVLA